MTNITENDHAAGRTKRPSPAARLFALGLTLLFLAFWAGLLGLMGRTLGQLVPAALALDPAALLLWLTLGPMTLHLAQAPFHRPRKPSGRPVFLALRESPLLFLPLASPGRLEPGPAFFAAAGPGDQARLLAEAEARLNYSGRLGRLSLLMADRSPLDLFLRRLGRGPWPLALPARLFRLLASPTRQLMRLWGFIFFKAARAWADPGPADGLTVYKRQVAWSLWRQARSLDPPMEDETLDDQVRRLARLRARLARSCQDPQYGARAGEPWPEAAPAPGGPEKAWLDPRYRGAFLDLPVTLYADDPAKLYAAGRFEKNPGFYYPPELAPEAEAAALMAAEGEFLARLLAVQAEDGLIRLDGRLWPSWDLAVELSHLESLYNRAMKRIFTHHARCRAAHLAEAEARGPGWPEALSDWGALLWLAEHGRQALTRAREDLQSALASPRVFPRAAAEKFYAVWADLKGRLAGLDRLPPVDLDPPAKANWPRWRSAWPAAWAGLDRVLARLRDQALTGLLAAEDQVAAGRAGPAASPPRAPVTADFPTPADRPRPLRVYYPSTRFKAGPVGSALAALTLALLLWQGWTRGLSEVTIYNGLPAAVTVSADGRAVTVPPADHRTIRLRPGVEHEFTAAVGGWVIETFRQSPAPGPAREVYNVAGAAPLMEWWFPQDENGSPELFLGRPRWLTTRATVLFKNPSGDRRVLVLSGYGHAGPEEMLAPFHDRDERAELARLHARHTHLTDPRFQAWLDHLPENEREAMILEGLSRAQAGEEPPPDPSDLIMELMDEPPPGRPGGAD